MDLVGRKGFNPTKKDATLAIDIISSVPFPGRVRCPFNLAGGSQLGLGTQLKFEKKNPLCVGVPAGNVIYLLCAGKNVFSVGTCEFMFFMMNYIVN